ncbi:unnamed protein product [Lactuca saligna]|uniref:Uncharacterized protein n=1 Tax=Lactuca saligna TaxID=75948 RepID=A0AA35YIT0_LACSI|nr:unnamed protein product [Lactuca saligna]
MGYDHWSLVYTDSSQHLMKFHLIWQSQPEESQIPKLPSETKASPKSEVSLLFLALISASPEQLRDEKFKAKEEDEDSAQEMARVIQRITELHDKGIAIYEVQRFQRLIKESWKGMLILVLKDNVGLMESNKADN